MKAARLFTLAKMGFTSHQIEELPYGHRLFMYACADSEHLIAMSNLKGGSGGRNLPPPPSSLNTPH